MTDTTTTTTSPTELLGEARDALLCASETLSFLLKCLARDPALDEPNVSGLAHVLEGLQHQIDVADDATDRATTLLAK